MSDPNIRILFTAAQGASIVDRHQRWVAECLAVPVADVQLSWGCMHCGASDHGQPKVCVAARDDVHISRSYCDGVAALAVAVGTPVGVDVVSDPLDRDWARYESVVKTVGTGVYCDRDDVAIERATEHHWRARISSEDFPALVATRVYGMDTALDIPAHITGGGPPSLVLAMASTVLVQDIAVAMDQADQPVGP